MKKCFFMGHRDCNEKIYNSLVDVVADLVLNFGVTEFIVGKYGKFDGMATRAVIQTKKIQSNIKLVLLSPYMPGLGFKVQEGFDEVYYPFEEKIPYRAAIVRANEKAIDQSDFIVAYVCRAGKSRDFLEHARIRERKGKLKIINLAEK